MELEHSYDELFALWCARRATRGILDDLRAMGTSPRDAIRQLWEGEHRPARWSDAANLETLLAEAAVELDALAEWENTHRRRIRVVPTTSVEPVVSDAAKSPFLVTLGSGELMIPGAIAVVGTRKLTHAGERLVRQMMQALVAARPPALVSGAARGVDRIAQSAAVVAGVPTTVVLAGGICGIDSRGDRRELAELLDVDGLIVTTRPPMESPRGWQFKERNAVISALSSAVLVARAGIPSGALGTAAYASKQGRPVFAMPGNPDDPSAEGCLELLARGEARVYRRPTDIIPALAAAGQGSLPGIHEGACRRVAPHRLVKDPDQRAVARVLSGMPTHADAIASRVGLTASRTARALLSLELAGIAERAANGEYRLTSHP